MLIILITGPFIVIVAHMGGDILRFGFLYFVFYVPYLCAFWMLFGGDKVPEEFQGRPEALNHTITVTGIQDVNALLFSLFRITLVDDYDYDVSVAYNFYVIKRTVVKTVSQN